MGCKYRCLIVFILINIISAIGCFVFLELKGVLNFEVGFFSFFIVLYSTYISLKKKVKKEIDGIEIIEEENEDEKKPKSRFSFSNLILGMQLSMSLFRIFAYLILICALMFLMGKNLFLVIPYILGIIICLSGIVGLKYFYQIPPKI